MATSFYEILLRGDATGKYQGGHIITAPGGIAQTIGPGLEFEWPDVIASVDTAALTRVSELESEKADVVTSKDAEKAVIEAEKAAIELSRGKLIAAAKDAALTEEQFQAIVTEEEQPERDRRDAEILRQITELEAKLSTPRA